MNNRVNIYGFPHKGLRNALGTLSFKAGNLMLDNQEQMDELKELSHEISELLELHLHSEERHVLPPLEKKVPGSTEGNHDDHVEMERLEKEMVEKVDTLHANPTIENSIAFYNHVNLFIREYFRHMDEEETQMNEVIWNNFEDQEILGWQGKILSELTPEQFFKWFKYIIPALQPHEQNAMLGGFKANAPAEAFNATIQGLRPFVSDAQFTHISNV